MSVIDKKSFETIFKSVWWAFMNYEYVPEKMELFYAKLKYLPEIYVFQAANTIIANNSHFPSVEEWTRLCYQHKAESEKKGELPPASPRQVALKNIMLPYFIGRESAEATYAKLPAFIEEHGGNIEDHDWLKKKKGFLWDKKMPEESDAMPEIKN